MRRLEDLEKRNPIIITKQVVHLSEDGKALFRKSPKFCPTPRGPIEEMEHYTRASSGSSRVSDGSGFITKI